ncbi:MAG: glycosyltransferase [Gammaproteobacteria bacterium]
MKKIAIAQFSFDGINSMTCGVGYFVQNLLQVIKHINQAQTDLHIVSILATPYYDDAMPSKSDKYLQESLDICHATEGNIYFVDNNFPQNIYEGSKQFEYISKAGSEILHQMLAEYHAIADEFIIILHDFHFAKVLMYYLESHHNLPNNCNIIWLPHTSSNIYYGNKINQLEIAQAWRCFEDDVVTFLNSSKAMKLACLNNIMEMEWLHEYAVEPQLLTSLKFGINFDRFANILQNDEIINMLNAFKIPADKKLIFSMGRATHIKGFDQTILWFKELSSLYPDLHLVLLAPRMEEEPTYPEKILQLIHAEKLTHAVTLIDTFETELPKAIMQHDQTMITTVFSRTDVMPLILMEARQHPHQAILLAANRGGIPDAINHGIDGFIFDYGAEGNESIIDAIKVAKKILALSPIERNRIITTANQTIREKFDLVKNFIDCVLPELSNKNIYQNSDINFSY